MVRMYKRKLLKLDESILSKAVDEVKNGQKLQTVAKKYNIARGTLRGRMNKTNTPLHHKRVFFLLKYLQICAKNKISIDYRSSLMNKRYLLKNI